MPIIKDPSLAKQGRLNISYAEAQMKPLMKLREEFSKTKPFSGIRIGLALHVTKETAVLVETLKSSGAKVAIASCNPLSTQDDAASALAENDIEVFAKKGETKEEYYDYINRVIATKPQITIDDGCDLVSEIHLKHPELIPGIIGGCEETTTGVIRLRAMEKDNALKYPIIAVNDNKTKHLFDNYYGTGQSSWDGILRATNTLVAGKTVVIAGYGDCGKGVALRAKGLGAKVIITEVSAFRALQALMDGFEVKKMDEAVKYGDIFITVTGNKTVLTEKHFLMMKPGAILANSGHFNIEIDIEALECLKTSKKRIRAFLDEYTIPHPHSANDHNNRSLPAVAPTLRRSEGGNGKKIYLLGEGRLINLAAAEGHPSEVMALSFAGQTLACKFLVDNKGNLTPTVHTLPEEIDDYIAKLALESMGVEIDNLTTEQAKYLGSWREGT